MISKFEASPAEIAICEIFQTYIFRVEYSVTVKIIFALPANKYILPGVTKSFSSEDYLLAQNNFDIS